MKQDNTIQIQRIIGVQSRTILCATASVEDLAFIKAGYDCRHVKHSFSNSKFLNLVKVEQTTKLCAVVVVSTRPCRNDDSVSINTFFSCLRQTTIFVLPTSVY